MGVGFLCTVCMLCMVKRRAMPCWRKSSKRPALQMDVGDEDGASNCSPTNMGRQLGRQTADEVIDKFDSPLIKEVPVVEDSLVVDESTRRPSDTLPFNATCDSNDASQDLSKAFVARSKVISATCDSHDASQDVSKPVNSSIAFTTETGGDL